MTGERCEKKPHCDAAAERPTFAELLSAFRCRARISQNALAPIVGVDPSYLNRLERAEREPPKRSLVDSLADALGLDAAEADRLLISAGHLPRALARLGPVDRTISLVADFLADESVPEAEREEFRQVVEILANRWGRPR